MPRLSRANSRTVSKRLPILFLIAAFATSATAQQGYKKPPQDVLDILAAPVTPLASVSPARDTILLSTGLRYPPIADLAQPMLRLAGLRINPNTFGPHRYQYAVALTLKRISDGSEIKIALPPGAKIGTPEWSANGSILPSRILPTTVSSFGLETALTGM